MESPTNSERQRQTEEALRQSGERFRLLVEGVKDYAIFMLDPQGYIVSWNSDAEHIKGYREEEILGQHFSVFYAEDDVERGHPEEELRPAATEGRYEEEGIRVRKDGSKFWANVLITALKDDAGDLRGFAKVTCDITERKEAEEGATTTFETVSPVLGTWVAGRAYPSPNRLSVYFEDVTERKRAENEIIVSMGSSRCAGIG